ncbi:MAG: GNAT family N-acetyltransferase [Pyrinomonadaceae bacterium]
MSISWEITDAPDNQRTRGLLAELLFDGFSDTGTTVWRTMAACFETVGESFKPGKINRIAMDDEGGIRGWATGAPLYENFTWELEILVVDRKSKCAGIGSALLSDFESQVADRGGLNVFLGSDDENGRTSIGEVELYPEPLEHLKAIENLGRHPFEFYLKQGYSITGVVPDANGPGKPDILLTKRVAN